MNETETTEQIYAHSIMISISNNRIGVIGRCARLVKFLRHIQEIPSDVRELATVRNIDRSTVAMNVILAFSNLIVLRLLVDR